MDNTRYKIALVDDNIATLNQGKSLLQELYRVYTVQSPVTFFENLEHDIPDLILLDVAMPEMDGFDVIKKLKADARYRDIPVMFLTAKSDEESEREGFRLGAVDYITKPFSGPLLQKRISNQILYKRVEAAVKDYSDDLEVMVSEITRANERTRILLDKTPLCARLWDSNRKLIDCNEAAASLFGFKDKQECLERYAELYPEYQSDGQRSDEKVIKCLDKAFNEGSYTLEWTYKMLDGTLMPAEIILVRVEYGDGYAVAGYTRDLREHYKMMERMLEDEERMHLMLDAMPMACRLVGRNYEFIDCNQQALDLVGVTSKEEYEKKLNDIIPEFQPCGRLSHELKMEHLDAAFDKGYLRFEWTYKKPDGESLPCEVTMVRVMYKGEHVIAGYIRDLREQKAVAEEMRRAEIAEESSKAKSRFLANMSHEMRTPLNVVVGLTSLMLEENNLALNLKENLNKISTAGSTLLGLINDVLDISKIEANKLELAQVKYEVPSLINDIINLNVIRIAEKPITFQLDINEDIFYRLYGDDLRVKQIINNLLSNAFKYTQKGTVSLGIKTEHSGQSVWMEIIVSDTGVGIRREDLEKIFTDYGQVDAQSNRRVEGTGLGLAITKRLVEMMGGEISVESEFGKDSVFRVRIQQGFVDNTPIGQAVAENLRKFRYTEDKLTVSKKLVREDLSFAKVLLVDDMQTNLDVAAGLLGKYKMRVDCVLSGEEAVEQMRRSETGGQQLYNAIFMDHMMPGMDGIETAKAIRNLGTEYARKIPIIALTANAIAGTEDMFYANDFQGFIPKPINTMHLDSVIRKWIKKKEE